MRHDSWPCGRFSVAIRELVRLLQVLTCRIQRALGVVVGLQRLAILVDRAFALAGEIEDLAELDVAPDLSPFRIAIAIQGVAVGVCRSLVIALQVEDFRDTVMRERTVAVDVERLLELAQGLSQIALLVVPVGIAKRRPITRRPLLLPIAVTGFMLGALVIGAGFALIEFMYKGGGDTAGIWIALAGGALTWVLWTAVFYRMSRNQEPADVITKQCSALLKGSILELLIAIPTHIVARSRDYCCAGFMTFVGLTLGISVMFLSYGPGVYFLFVDRWNRTYKRFKPDCDSAP